MDDDMSDDTDDDMDEEMKEEADNTPLIKLNWGERGKLLTEERVMIIRRALKMHLKMHTAPSDKEIRHMKTMFDLAESKSSPLPKP